MDECRNSRTKQYETGAAQLRPTVVSSAVTGEALVRINRSLLFGRRPRWLARFGEPGRRRSSGGLHLVLFRLLRLFIASHLPFGHRLSPRLIRLYDQMWPSLPRAARRQAPKKSRGAGASDALGYNVILLRTKNPGRRERRPGSDDTSEGQKRSEAVKASRDQTFFSTFLTIG